MSSNRFGLYTLIIMQMEHRELYMFDPCPFSSSSKELDCRWTEKSDIIWPWFRDAMISLYNQCQRDRWGWNKHVMDKDMEEKKKVIYW